MRVRFLVFAFMLVVGCERRSDLYALDAAATQAGGEPVAPAGPELEPVEPGDARKGAQCAANYECGSSVCTQDDVCADPADVAKVAPGRDGNCITSECGTVAAALATGRPYIVININHNEALTESIDIAKPGSVTLVGYFGTSSLVTSNPALPIVRVRGGAAVTLQNLSLSGQRGAVGVPCVDVTNALLTLHRASVSSCAGVAVNASGSNVTIRRATLRGNAGGLLAKQSIVKVARSRFENNTQASVLAFRDEWQGGFDRRLVVENSVFAHNAVGVELATAMPVTFTHDTFVSGQAGLVTCTKLAASAPRPLFLASVFMSDGPAPSGACQHI